MAYVVFRLPDGLNIPRVISLIQIGSVGLGPGLSVKGFRRVFIFHDAEKLEKFIDRVWTFSVQTDSAAKSDTKGAQAGDAGTITKGVELYHLTMNGLTLQTTKYWRDCDLND